MPAPQTQARSAWRPRLVPLAGPRRQSITILVSIRGLSLALMLPLLGVAMADSALRSPFIAEIVRWSTSSLLFVCAIGAVVVGKRPEQEGRRYLFAVAFLLGLSLLEATPAHAWPALIASAAGLAHYPFLTLVAAATLACAALATAAKHRGGTALAMAFIVYLGGVVAGLLSADTPLEHPLTGLLRSTANLGRMLGPALALRALLRQLTFAERPTALRFVVVPALGDPQAARTAS